MKGLAGLICKCGSHEVVYTDTAGMYRCKKCRSVGFRGAFKSWDEEEGEGEEEDE
jgi:hypothetical protein